MEKSHASQAAGASPDEFVIRPAVADDAAAILQCLRAAFAPYRSQYTPQGYLDTVMTPDTLLQRLASMTVLVAVDARRNVVGTIGGAVVSSSEGHLRGMAVLPGWHGRGIAQLLLDAIEKHLIGGSRTRISLHTNETLYRAMPLLKKKAIPHTANV